MSADETETTEAETERDARDDSAPPKSVGPDLSHLTDENAKTAIREYLAKAPRAMLFTFNVADDPRDFVGRVIPFKKVTKFGELLSKKNPQTDSTMTAVIRDYLVYPRLTDEILYDETKILPGHVVKIFNCLQVGSGFEGDDAVKKLLTAAGAASGKAVTNLRAD